MQEETGAPRRRRADLVRGVIRASGSGARGRGRIESMTALRFRMTVRSTTLELPELAPLVGHRVEMLVREEGADAWPEGWFEATAGAIPDFVRPPQPEPERRPPVEP